MALKSFGSLELRRDDTQEAIDITPFVKKFVWTESMIAGGFSWSLEFLSGSWREWDALMLGKERPTFQFRLQSEEETGLQSTEWRTAVTDKSRAAFSQDTSMVAGIKGADRRLDMAQQARTRAFRDLTVSSLLTRIANEHGLSSSIVSTGAEDSWVQVRMNDWAFARQIARSAATESGRGDTYLWIDEDTLFFQAPQLTDASDRRYDLSVVENRMNGYVCTYNGRVADRGGAARLSGVGFDFNTKTGVVFQVNPDTATTQPSLASRVPRLMNEGLRVFPVFEQTPARVEGYVRSRWGRFAPRYLGIRATTRPDLTLKPNSIISMEGNMDERRVAPFMGRYVAVEVEHVMEKGGTITSGFVGYRREAQEGDAQPTGANADIDATRDRDQQVGIRPRTILVAQEI